MRGSLFLDYHPGKGKKKKKSFIRILLEFGGG